MSKIIITVFKALLFLSVGIFFLYLAFRDIHFSELLYGLKNADYSWVLLSLFFAFMAFVSRAMRWIILIEPLGYKPSFKNTFYALMSGYLANFLLPRIGELTRCGSLNRTDRIPVDSLLGTVIIDRIFDVLMLLLLLAVVFVLKIDFFGEFMTENIFIPVFERFSAMLNFPALVWILAGFFIFALFVLILIIRTKIVKNRLFGFVGKTAYGVFNGMKTLFRMKKKWQFIGHTLFIWAMYFLMTWVVFFSLPSTSTLQPADALFLLVIGGMGMSAPVQAGIGAYHWIVSLGLTLYNIPREEGIIFAVIAHESQALLMIVLGTFSLAMVFLQKKPSIKTNP